MQRHGEMFLCHLGLQPRFMCWNGLQGFPESIYRKMLSQEPTALLSFQGKPTRTEAGTEPPHPPCPLRVLMRESGPLSHHSEFSNPTRSEAQLWGPKRKLLLASLI